MQFTFAMEVIERKLFHQNKYEILSIIHQNNNLLQSLTTFIDQFAVPHQEENAKLKTGIKCSDKVDEKEVVSLNSTPWKIIRAYFYSLRPWILTNITLWSFQDDIPSLRNMSKQQLLQKFLQLTHSTL